ncbi:MAG: GntR family transcriptional regulator, partial [Muribaculaceae bacterium]|nr:GntR family transcriptional regulator [Muribaculaceae bacterium]
MIKIGRDNAMRVVKMVDFGAYLTDASGDDDREILLPKRYMPDDLRPDDTIDVFVYKDSENRLIATTEEPYARVGEFAFLQVVQVNATGAFLDWGLPTKNLLVPYSEQKVKMRAGGVY